MITAPPGVRVLVWPAPVDFRRGMDSLAALVQVALRLDPFAGDVFVFRSRRSDRVKLLLYDGTGLILITKRLEAGRFKWPPVTGGVVRLSALQLSVLLAYFGESALAFRFKPPTVSVISPTLLIGLVGERRRDPWFSPYAGIAGRAKRHDDDEGSAALWSAARTRRMDSPVSSIRSAR